MIDVLVWGVGCGDGGNFNSQSEILLILKVCVYIYIGEGGVFWFKIPLTNMIKGDPKQSRITGPIKRNDIKKKI